MKTYLVTLLITCAEDRNPQIWDWSAIVDEEATLLVSTEVPDYPDYPETYLPDTPGGY